MLLEMAKRFALKNYGIPRFYALFSVALMTLLASTQSTASKTEKVINRL
jgi:hypothetical protein